jgi:hypothetical protein
MTAGLDRIRTDRKPESAAYDDNLISTTKTREKLDGLSDREIMLQIYDMHSAQQEQIDRILKMTGSGDDTGTV